MMPVRSLLQIEWLRRFLYHDLGHVGLRKRHCPLSFIPFMIPNQRECSLYKKGIPDFGDFIKEVLCWRSMLISLLEGMHGMLIEGYGKSTLWPWWEFLI